MKAIIETTELKRLIKATKKFVRKDDDRPMLKWIELNFDKTTEIITAYACDGYKMVVETVKTMGTDENFKAYIKPDIQVGAKGAYASIELVSGNLYINIDGRISGYTQPDGEYLDCKKLIEGFEAFDIPADAMADPSLLADALNSVLEDAYSRKRVTLQIRDGYGPITIKTETGARYVLPCRK